MTRRRARQLTFADLQRRRRKKPGPKAGPRPAVRHRARPVHKHWHPMHITLRALAGLPSFRAQVLYKAFVRAFRRTRREDFRIVEYSVQSNHLHLIVEADGNDALARGMKSFSVRANRLFNVASGRRRGRVWGDRYHRVDLKTPRQVRNALVYCLNNLKKHARMGTGAPTFDACSSASWFTGWTNAAVPRAVPRAGPCNAASSTEPASTAAAPTHQASNRPTEQAQTYLLRTGWQKHGFIHPGERPSA